MFNITSLGDLYFDILFKELLNIDFFSKIVD